MKPKPSNAMMIVPLEPPRQGVSFEQYSQYVESYKLYVDYVKSVREEVAKTREAAKAAKPEPAPVVAKPPKKPRSDAEKAATKRAKNRRKRERRAIKKAEAKVVILEAKAKVANAVNKLAKATGKVIEGKSYASAAKGASSDHAAVPKKDKLKLTKIPGGLGEVVLAGKTSKERRKAARAVAKDPDLMRFAQRSELLLGKQALALKDALRVKGEKPPLKVNDGPLHMGLDAAHVEEFNEELAEEDPVAAIGGKRNLQAERTRNRGEVTRKQEEANEDRIDRMISAKGLTPAQFAAKADFSVVPPTPAAKAAAVVAQSSNPVKPAAQSGSRDYVALYDTGGTRRAVWRTEFERDYITCNKDRFTGKKYPKPPKELLMIDTTDYLHKSDTKTVWFWDGKFLQSNVK